MKHNSKVFSDNNFSMDDPVHIRNQKFMSRIQRRARTVTGAGCGWGWGRAWSMADRDRNGLGQRVLAVLTLLHSKGKAMRTHLDGTKFARSKTRIDGYAKHRMSRNRLAGVHGSLVASAKKEGLL